jgi:hypothetical protein
MLQFVDTPEQDRPVERGVVMQPPARTMAQVRRDTAAASSQALQQLKQLQQKQRAERIEAGRLHAGVGARPGPRSSSSSSNATSKSVRDKAMSGAAVSFQKMMQHTMHIMPVGQKARQMAHNQQHYAPSGGKSNKRSRAPAPYSSSNSSSRRRNSSSDRPVSEGGDTSGHDALPLLPLPPALSPFALRTSLPPLPPHLSTTTPQLLYAAASSICLHAPSLLPPPPCSPAGMLTAEPTSDFENSSSSSEQPLQAVAAAVFYDARTELVD